MAVFDPTQTPDPSAALPVLVHHAEDVDPRLLTPHSRNYRVHPPDEIEHLMASMRQHGVYRNVIVAQDNTILAGHGVVQAALKLLVGDNEISHLVDRDDRRLTELLKEVKDLDPHALLGTGYDEMMLTNLLMVTRPTSEIADFDEAAEWVGLPGFERGSSVIKMTVSFRAQTDRNEFCRRLGLNLPEQTRSTWWPAKEDDDIDVVRFEHPDSPNGPVTPAPLGVVRT